MLDPIKSILGAGGFIDQPDQMQGYLKPWRGEKIGEAALVALPDSTAELADVVKYCADQRIPMVPQAGNTGLVDGSLPIHPNAILINTSRMRAIRQVNKAGSSLTVEAGVVLTAIQEQATQLGMLFPLSMASEGSAMLGGMVATNPGGTAVLRYGNFREMVLGLEVVLPNGNIWSDLRSLRKNNSGYDLKNLFIGSEGTLGIITAATLKLFPQVKQKSTAIIAVDTLDDALTCFNQLQKRFGGGLTAFEMFSDICANIVLQHMPDMNFPLSLRAPYYALIECSSELEGGFLRELFEQGLMAAWEVANIKDAVIAASDDQAHKLWALRENISESARHFGSGFHFDISVPIEHMPVFIDQTNASIQQALPEITPVAFGHMGDGNVHYNQYIKGETSQEDLSEIRGQLEDIIYPACIKLGGAVSAEHGIGLDRQNAFYHYADPTLISLMQQIKTTLDPHNLMNPGKVLK